MSHLWRRAVLGNTNFVFSVVFLYQNEGLWPRKNHFAGERWHHKTTNLSFFGSSMNFCAPWIYFFFSCLFELNLVTFLGFVFHQLSLESITHVVSILCTINVLYKGLMWFMVYLCVLAVFRMLVFSHRKIGWCLVGYANECVNSLSIFTCHKL